ncbi:MAG: molybdenum cofactor cytidylyltransferase [Acidimicrobiaceae bacterium]|nr:molybdenum cofactor cytidylyltransferase [Acidimicrobiaceae bacterium]
MTVAAVVLAAGAGSRFAGPEHKLATDVRGRRLVDWAVEHARDAALDDLIVVVGAVELGIPEAVVNERWADGLASSLQCAVGVARARGHEAVVVAHGDQPGIVPAAWRAVGAALSTSGRPVVIARYPNGRGHPVGLAEAVWPLLPVAGDEGAAALMRDRPDWVAEVACDGDPADVDTLEDLHRWS